MKKFNRLLSLLLFCLMLGMGSAAFAENPSFMLPAEIQVQGPEDSKPPEFKLQLKAVSEGAPMPEGSSDGVFILEFSGPGKKNFPPISCSQLGRYYYEISQLPFQKQYYSPDKTVYKMELLVQWGAQGLSPSVVLSTPGNSEKANELLFLNKYNPPPEPKPFPQTGDGENILMYLGFGAASLLMLLLILPKLKKEKRN